MKAYKNGICREIDKKREQEFREKGYSIEGKSAIDDMQLVKQENEALKAQNEALKAEMQAMLQAEAEKLKTQMGGDENGATDGNESTGSERTEKTQIATRGRK